jgi:hypothetical protein
MEDDAEGSDGLNDIGSGVEDIPSAVPLRYRWVMSSDSERSRRSTAPTGNGQHAGSSQCGVGRISMLRGRPGESRKSTPALIARINGSPSCQPVMAASSTAASMLSKFVRSIRSITGPIRRPIGPPLGTYR